MDEKTKMNEVATKGYVHEALEKTKNEIIDTILKHMPNKDDYVTRNEFNELKHTVGSMQEILLQMNDKLDKQMEFYNKHLYENTRRIDYNSNQITLIKRRIGMQAIN